MNAGCFGASRRILLQMADLLFFWIVSYPGLYVGAAGCGSSLLRAYAALTGKKLTNLYEYHFFEKI